MLAPNTDPAGPTSMRIEKEIVIEAPIEIVFESMLDELGPECQWMEGAPFPMKLEAWPGGRWYRDGGNNTGHFWGHVHVIKPPTMLMVKATARMVCAVKKSAR